MPDSAATDNTLDRLLTFSVLEQSWPQEDAPRTYCLEKALHACGAGADADDLRRVIKSFQAHQAMAGSPIIAVLGELNSGKSSVVASFLSKQGRDRLPRGEEDAKGTHRFVYWVPASWEQAVDKRQAFVELLKGAHSDEYEFLSLDPDQAEAQYRSGRDRVEILKVPLIAYDSALDEIGAAFLDCPDVQTKDQDDATGVNHRLAFVAQASRLCSAFLFVWERSKVRDALLTTFLSNLRATVANGPIYLLVNKIRPERGQPTKTRNDSNITANMRRFGIESHACFGALDFDIEERRNEPSWSQLTPPELVKRFHRDDPSPQFFSLDNDESRNQPEAVGCDRFLSMLPSRLDPAVLQRRALADRQDELRNKVKRSFEMVSPWVDLENEKTKRVHAGLLAFCVDQFTSKPGGEPLQVMTKEFRQAFITSFSKAAPLYLMPGIWFQNQLTAITSNAVKLVSATKQWVIDMLGSKSTIDAPQELHGSGISGTNIQNPESLARQMMTQRWISATQSEAELIDAWRAVIEAYNAHPLPIDVGALDEATKKFWSNLSGWSRFKLSAFQALGILGSLLLVVGTITAMIDGGATFLASYPLAHVISTAIYGKAFVGAAVVGGAGAGVAGFLVGMAQTNTLPYLSLFFKLACNAFGLPERLNGKENRVTIGETIIDEPLPDLNVPGLPKQICKLGDFGVWQITANWEDFSKGLSNDGIT